MSTTSTEANMTSSAPCPVAKLPVELREMIYHHYFNLMKASRPQQIRTGYYSDHSETRPSEVPNRVSGFQNLKPYFSMLHLSSVVRSETAAKIYKRAFKNFWFSLEVDNTRNDIEHAKAMLTTVSKTNEDVEFGLRFGVSHCSRDVFLQFVDSILELFGSESELWDEYDDRWKNPEEKGGKDLKSPEPKVGYMEETDWDDCHRLWLFGALAKYDWSGFEFSLPSPVGACASDITHLDASYYPLQSVEDDGESGLEEKVDDDDDNDAGLDDGNEFISSHSDDEDGEGLVSTEDEDGSGMLGSEDE